MKRSTFLAGLALGILRAPLALKAQQAKRPVRIGFLPFGSPSNSYDLSLVEGFRRGLGEVGLVEDRDIVLDVVWISNEPEIPQAVSGLVERGAELLIPVGTSASTVVKRQVTKIPVLFINVGNPVGIGLVESLSRPGGNITGFSDMLADLSGKYVELARELGEPQATVNYLWYTEWADGKNRFQYSEQTAKSLGVELRSRGISDIAEASDVIARMKASGAATVIIQPSPFTYRHRISLINTAMKHGLATIFGFPAAGRDGALIAYGPDYLDTYRRTPSYIARILNGAKPAELAVQQPTKFEFIINLKTAKALSLTIPPSLLIRADEVIE